MSRLGDRSSSFRALASAGRRGGSPPWTPLSKPVSECTLAVVSSSAYVDVAPVLDRPGVELCGFRFFSDDELAPAPAAAQAHHSPDHSRFEADRLGVAVGRARELVAGGRVGRLAQSHAALAGAVDSRARLMREAQAAAGRLAGDQVDVVLLVPM
jgi:D-proline reductase (dithiol) PrdB